MKSFLKDAGTVIMAFTIVLWALLSYPSAPPEGQARAESAEAAQALQLEHSFGGRIGKAMEPALEPLGLDWRMGVGVLGAFAAREVFVSTLGVVFGLSATDEDDASLRETLRNARRSTGEPLLTPLSGVALMVFFVFACQCMSTLAVVRRETRSWRWPLVMLGSMTAVAYLMALVVYQVGGWFGFA